MDGSQDNCWCRCTANTNVLMNSDCIVPVQQCTRFPKEDIYAQIRYLETGTKKAKPPARLYDCLWHPLLSFEKTLTSDVAGGHPRSRCKGNLCLAQGLPRAGREGSPGTLRPSHTRGTGRRVQGLL